MNRELWNHLTSFERLDFLERIYPWYGGDRTFHDDLKSISIRDWGSLRFATQITLERIV